MFWSVSQMDYVALKDQKSRPLAGRAVRLRVFVQLMKIAFQCYLRQFSGLLRRVANALGEATWPYGAAAGAPFRCDFSVTFRKARRIGGVAVDWSVWQLAEMKAPPLAISQRIIDQMIAVADASPNLEVCGMLFGTPDCVEGVQSALNVADNPAERFEIDPAALIAAHRKARAGGAALAGCYHSHPNGLREPSACDAEMALEAGWVWLIVAGGEVTAWRAVEGGALHGRFDPLPILPC
jgi:desampylase